MQKWNWRLNRKNISIEDIGNPTKNSNTLRLTPHNRRPQWMVRRSVPIKGKYFIHQTVARVLLSHPTTALKGLIFCFNIVSAS